VRFRTRDFLGIRHFISIDHRRIGISAWADEEGTLTLTTKPFVREVELSDYNSWLPLWNGYNAFYGRHGDRALPDQITTSTWGRLLAPEEPVHALVAEIGGELVGLAHFLYAAPWIRGNGIGRALIEGVCERAHSSGVSRVYWQTHESNLAGRRLYDQVARHEGFIVYSREHGGESP
jgi:GNAT superfamily N-acetyltransferase